VTPVGRRQRRHVDDGGVEGAGDRGEHLRRRVLAPALELGEVLR
jgi:hypothetical protein